MTKKTIRNLIVIFSSVIITATFSVVLYIWHDSNWFTNNIRESVTRPELFTNDKLIHREDGPVVNLNGDQRSTGTYQFTPAEMDLLLSDGGPFKCSGEITCGSYEEYFNWSDNKIGLTKDIYIDKSKSTVEVVISYW